MKDYTSKDFEDIAVYGRVAYTAACLEYYYLNNQYESFLVEKYIEHLWYYVKYDTLGPWDYIAENMINDILISEPDIPNHFQFMMDISFKIATRDWYGQHDNEASLKLIDSLIGQYSELNLNLPNVEVFRVFKVTDRHGWGEPLNPSDIRRAVLQES